jgi:hypothetical protein
MNKSEDDCLCMAKSGSVYPIALIDGKSGRGNKLDIMWLFGPSYVVPSEGRR